MAIGVEITCKLRGTGDCPINLCETFSIIDGAPNQKEAFTQAMVLLVNNNIKDCNRCKDLQGADLANQFSGVVLGAT